MCDSCLSVRAHTLAALGRWVAYHPRQPGTFGCLFPSTTSPPIIEALLPSGRRPRAEDAKLRDRSAPDVCPIAILRGLLL